MPGEDPAWHILRVLTGAIGLPFVMLSATSPLVQNWFSRRGSGSRAYRLFALSNLASLLALLSYPFLIEPNSTVHHQANLWAVGFAVFVVLGGLVASISRNPIVSATGTLSETEANPTLRLKVLWFSLAACGSMLLLSITNHLSQNVAPVPLLWIHPALALSADVYPRFRAPEVLFKMVILATAGGLLRLARIRDVRLPFRSGFTTQLALFCGGLFVCCMFCHGELSRMKPAAQAPDPVLPSALIRRSCRSHLHRTYCASYLRRHLRGSGHSLRHGGSRPDRVLGEGGFLAPYGLP